jgi:hypothetical protein
MASRKTKRERFVELAPKRVNAALAAIRRVGNCGAKNSYEYTDAELDAIFQALDAAILSARGNFVRSTDEPEDKPKRPQFALPGVAS